VTDPAPTAAAPASIHRDVLSAYAASAAKIGSWVVVLGMIYRFCGDAEFAVLALIRGTIGILNYTTLGLSPAMIRVLEEARSAPARDAQALGYYSPEPERNVQSLYANGLMIALLCGAAGIVLSIAYAYGFRHFYHLPNRVDDSFWPVLLIGAGTTLRLMSDAPGSLLQSHALIAKDNWRLVEAELAWVILCLIAPLNQDDPLAVVGLFYAAAGAILFLRRSWYAQQLTKLWFPQWRLIDEATIKRLLSFGSLVLFAQLADYLYAPTDYILINRLLGWTDVAVYTPAMQIDAGLLLLVTGLSSVILPRTALAHTAGEAERVRRYYVVGTLASAFLLGAAAIVVYFASPLIFRLWLGDAMVPTQKILPLVLIHTVVGGSSAVGRSILLGMGKVRAFTSAVLIAGVGNVVLSYIFVRHLHLGLAGIVYGTIVVVVVRCAIWMPWYVMRCLRSDPGLR
jgi:O-antigen/teichoic acid export membrane protein